MWRSALLCSAALVITSGANSAWAQTAAPAGDDAQAAEVEEIIVTGSRIKRVDLSSATPVQVIGQERLDGQGYENVADVLTTLPQFAASFGSSRTQSTFSGTQSAGLNASNLRNLGSNRSLTLVNGRRAPSGIATSNTVDLNLMPSANIARIDVVTGGAAAVYGADAVAGVVNIITDKNLDGFEFGASYGMAVETKDNINPNAYLRWGKVFDKGYFNSTFQYDYQGNVACADRYICAEDFFWNYPGTPSRGPNAYSAVAPQGTFFINGPNTAFNGGFTSRDGSFLGTVNAQNPNGVIKFETPIDGYNRNGARTLAQPTDRILVASQGEYAINDQVRLFTELNFSTAQTNATFEGHPFQSSSNKIAGETEVTIPVDNPFLPANLRQQAIDAGDTELSWQQRFDGLGKRGSVNDRTMVRLVGGAAGEFDSLFGFGSDWSWEASYTYGRFTQDGQTEGLVSLTALYDGLRVVETAPGSGVYQCASATARAQGCVPVNPFDGYTAQEAAYLTRKAGLHGEYEMEQGLAFLSGTLFELPAGPLQAALGLESNRTTASLDYDTDINLGLVTGNQIGDNEEQTFRTNEVYVETVVPVLKDLPFADSVNLEGGYRWSDSSRFGDYQTWKVGGDWAPVSGLRFRVMKNKAVRAPTLGEVSGVGQTFGNLSDPCTAVNRNANATRAANCLADGVPAAYAPPQSVLQNVSGFVGGNPNLKPEEAETFTYGVVFSAREFDFVPNWLSSLNVQVDRFEMDIEGMINTIGRQTIANLCYDTAGAARDFYCSQVTRGEHPQVGGADYVLLSVNDQLQNIAATSIAGVDVQVDWNMALEEVFARDLGKVSFNAVMTFYDEASLVGLPGQKPLDLLGFAGGSTSTQGYLKKQGNFTFGYNYGPAKALWVTRYIGEAGMHPNFPNYPKVGAHTYHDLRLSWDVNDSINLYGGVNNLFDQDPPFFVSSASGTQALDTIPAYYDVFGRQMYVGFKAKF